jgi:outer membrane protein assembly factor BamB
VAVSAVILGLAELGWLDGPRAGAATTPAPWPMALHDPSHSATAGVVGPQSGHILWARQLGGNVTPGPVVGPDGTIYLATNAGVLHALNPSTGQDVWTVDGGGALTGETDLSASPLVLPDGSLLWPGPRQTLFEVSASGTVQWSHRFSGQVLSPVLSGSTAYVVTMDGTMAAIRLGGPHPTVAWAIPLGHPSFGSPVVARPDLVVTTADRSLVAVDDHGAHGSIAWRHSLSADVEVSASAGADGRVFVTDNHGTAYSFDRSGRLIWRRRVGSESYSSSSVSPSGLFYVGDNLGNLTVVKAATGAPVRVIHTGRSGLWAAQVIDRRGDVYVGTQGRSIKGYGPGGRELFQIPISGSVDGYPALTANGTLIVGDQAGTVYAVGGPG